MDFYSEIFINNVQFYPIKIYVDDALITGENYYVLLGVNAVEVPVANYHI